MAFRLDFHAVPPDEKQHRRAVAMGRCKEGAGHWQGWCPWAGDGPRTAGLCSCGAAEAAARSFPATAPPFPRQLPVCLGGQLTAMLSVPGRRFQSQQLQKFRSTVISRAILKCSN